jgi:hypothetical protein
MDPVTMIAVAQAGVRLYSMFRSNGGGIGKLLAAQTQMLQEIGNQIRVINGKLDAVYRGILDLKNDVRALPRDAALKAVETTLSGLFIEAKEVLAVRTADERERGIEYAIRESTPRATAILDKLTTARSSLIADGSVALSPFVAAAWYVELQLMASCIPFKEGRLEEAALTYAESFERWLREDLRPTHAALNAAAVTLRDAIEAWKARQGYDCVHSIHIDWQDRRIGGGGPNGNQETIRTYTVTATKAQLSAQPSRVTAALAVYHDELAFLTDTGIEIERASFVIAPLHWTQTQTPISRAFKEDERGANAFKTALHKRACAEPPAFAQSFVAAENAHETTAEPLLARMVVNAHFMLLCDEALTSTRGIRDRSLAAPALTSAQPPSGT